jgi:hypothetical protein
MHRARRLGMLAAAALLGGGCGSSSGAGHDAADGGSDAPFETAEAGDAPAETTDGGVIAEYDLGGDFSIANNPSGPWRYGYTQGTTLAASAFTADGFAADLAPVGFWHPSDTVYYPYVAANETQATVADATNSWAVRAREIAMEASQDAQFSVVQFVAPATASYEIQADFTGIHFRLSSTDVHVLLGDTAIFDADIDGYGGDPAFHAVEGQSPRASFHDTRPLAAGDVLSFAVGVGQNGTYFNDTTGLIVHIVARD